AVQRSLFYFARMSREAIPYLKAAGGGRIINLLASTIYQPLLKMALSGMTRIGVTAFTKSLADEVAKYGILVNNVSPGSILTERMLLNITARAEEMGITLEEALAKRSAEIPVGRLGDPKDIAYTIAFLASGKSGYTTGSNIRVDGGVVRSVL
ncbi:MAG: SDR family oxidoreductase, partial [Proteobacteria bacterium]|nr:SDR family oxidoreductase [Pseudomonadota bacterium]